MKKNYSKPAMSVVELKQRNQFLMASQVTTFSSNAGLNYGGRSVETDHDNDDDIIR